MSQMYGWVGKLLFVDLSASRIEKRDTERYAGEYIGGRGFASRVAWDELPDGAGALDPDNILMITVGPLTGTTAPHSGRTTVSGLSPQGWPHEWFSRAGFGGRFGPSLKYAGFDGIFVKGKAAEPVYLWIEDGKVEIRSAKHLWGKGIFETQQTLMAEHGPGVRIITIGQAGENLSRIAIITTETESSAGQGGYGAVMGSKNLKAIVVSGNGAVRLARPDEFLRKTRLIATECHASHSFHKFVPLEPEKVEKYGQRWQACTQQCSQRCVSSRFYSKVIGPTTGRVCAGQFHCVGTLFPGFPGSFYDWNIGFEAGFEVANYVNDWGLNHWDVLMGIIPWLRACVQAGYLKDIDGLKFDLNDPKFWIELMRKITFRQGIGEALAEGGRRAPALLGFGEDVSKPLYAAWGYAGHWDGHGDHGNVIIFPFWLVPALQWAVDVRDPLASGHGYGQVIMNWSPMVNPENGLSWETIKRVGAMVWKGPHAADVESGYEDKAYPAVFEGNRSILKDSLTLDDQMYPRIFSAKTPDGYARVDGMEGPQFEWHMFSAATGLDISYEELDQCAERVVNLERALQIRRYGRSRRDDESIIPYLEAEENLVNPFIGKKQALDRQKFLALMDQYYDLRGWDRVTGWPARAKLTQLGLKDVAQRLYPSS
jgi:aldehyde:ferredoxin oxidoreductase